MASAQTWQDITANAPGPFTSGNQRPLDTDGTRLYVLGNRGVYVSADNGASFTAINDVAGASYSLTNLGHRFIRYVNGYVWVGSDPGSTAINDGHATLHRLVPGQTVWQKCSNGFPIGTTGNQADDVAYDASTGTYYAVGAIGGAFVSTNGVDWEQRNNGITGGIGLPASVVAFNGQAFLLRPLAKVYRTTNQGASWTALNSHPGTASGFLTEHNGRVFFSTTGNTQLEDGLYYTDDHGATWNFIFNNALKLTADVSRYGDLLYAAGLFGDAFYAPVRGQPGFKFSATAGLTWDSLPTNGLTTTLLGFTANRIVRQGDYLFMHSGTNLYRLDVSAVDFTPSTQIARQPESSITRLTGQPFQLSVLAGGANLAYQWQRDEVDIPGATSAFYSVASALTNDTGAYRVIVTGSRGAVTSSVANVTIILREEGRPDPTYPSLSLGGSLQILPNGELLTFNNNSFTRLSPEGVTLASRTVSGVNTFTSFSLLDTSNRVILLSGSPSRLWRILPDTLANDPAFNQLTANATIRAITEWPGHGYFVGGDFTTVTNAGMATHTAYYLVLINYSGVVETAFNLTNGPNASIYNVVVDSGTNIYVHGTFTAWAGTQLFQNAGLVKLNAGLTRDPSFAATAPLTDGTTKFYPLAPGRILALAGNNTAAPLVMLADGTPDPNYNTALHRFSSFVYGVAVGESNKLYLGGDFNRYGTNFNAGYLRLLPDGSVDMTFYNSSGSGRISSIAYDPRGYLYYTRSTNPRGPFRVFAGIAQAASTGGFAEWVTQFGLAQDHQAAGVDADGDGLPNIFEYYFGSNPADAASGTNTAPLVVTESGVEYPAITFVRSQSATGVTLLPRASSTVEMTDSLGTVVHSVVNLGGGMEQVTIRSVVNRSALPAQFLRIQLSVP